MGRKAKSENGREILFNGVPIEEVPFNEAAIHYDDSVVKDLCGAIICQAVRDWHEIKRQGSIYIEAHGKEIVYRAEVMNFFNSTYCCDMLALIFAPNVETGKAVKSMSEYPLGRRQLGWGRGEMGDTAIKKRREEKGCKSKGDL